MQLHDQLLTEHSRANCDAIVQWIANDQSHFDQLFLFFTGDDYRLAQRAAWPLSYAVISNPPLVKKHFTNLVGNLRKPGIHNAVKRNTLRLLQQIAIPKKFHGLVMDACFTFIATPAEPVAIKAFSLTVLERLAEQYPDIVPEVKLLIEENYQRETVAFQARAKKFCKKYS